MLTSFIMFLYQFAFKIVTALASSSAPQRAQYTPRSPPPCRLLTRTTASWY